MKYFIVIFAFASLLIIIPLDLLPQNPQATIKIDTKNPMPDTTSRLIFGGFIEYLLDYVNGPNGMWAQEFMDRGFDILDCENVNVGCAWKNSKRYKEDTIIYLPGGYNPNGEYFIRLEGKNLDSQTGVYQTIVSAKGIENNIYIYAKSDDPNVQLGIAAFDTINHKFLARSERDSLTSDWKRYKIIFPSGEWTIKTIDEAGLLRKSEDNKGNEINYSYHDNGNIENITVNYANPQQDQQVTDINVITKYDRYGQKIYLKDPDAGISTFAYNRFGEIIQANNPNAQKSIEYDVLGRIKRKEFTELNDNNNQYEILYQYVESGNGIEQLEKVTGPKPLGQASDMAIAFNYDNFGRIIKQTETVTNIDFVSEMTYNPLTGEIKSKKYPSGVLLDFTFDDLGYKTAITRINASPNPNEILWQLNSLNESGSLTKATMADGLLETGYKFEGEYKNLSNIYTKLIPSNYPYQNTNYEWFYQSGNLKKRTDDVYAENEEFSYDNLNRLEKCTTNAVVTNLEYNNDGGIKKKYITGDYSNIYDYSQVQGQPVHAPKKMGAETGTPEQSTQEYKYTCFNSVKVISDDVNETRIYYGYDDQRRKMEYYSVDNQSGPPVYTLLYTKYYLGSVEKVVKPDGTVVETTYLGAKNGVYAAVQKTTELGLTPVENTYYILKDHLGSVCRLINKDGTEVPDAEFSYDPWGNLRSATDWNSNSLPVESEVAFSILDRGYTGHEHLTKYSLINMNGRVYDPLLGMFTQADNYIQNPDNSQSYNRFTYCLNNPLKYTDPNGEFFWGILIGMAASYISNGISEGDWLSAKAFCNLIIGMVAGGIGTGITGLATKLIGNSLIGGTIGGMASGLFSEYGNCIARGQSASHGRYGLSLLSGSLSGFIGGLAQSISGDPAKFSIFKLSATTVGGGFIGGIMSSINGGSFKDGFQMGAIGGAVGYVGSWAAAYYDDQNIKLRAFRDKCIKKFGYDPLEGLDGFDNKGRILVSKTEWITADDWQEFVNDFRKENYGDFPQSKKNNDISDGNSIKIGRVHIRFGNYAMFDNSISGFGSIFMGSHNQMDGNAVSAYGLECPRFDSNQNTMKYSFNIHYDTFDVALFPILHFFNDSVNQHRLGAD